MGFHVIECDLGGGFSIVSNQTFNQAQINIYFDNHQIGEATIVTDFVDTEFVTISKLETAFVSHKVSNNRTLGEAIVKFLIKFPNIVRKPEFRFFVAMPEVLTSLIEKKYHFEHKKTKDILVRELAILSEPIALENIIFTKMIPESMYPDVLVLLQTDAYWQAHLTQERLNLLIQSSQCLFAFRDRELVGFLRVLTDNQSFASLWDVVVKKCVRRQGIGKAMMFHIFSNPVYVSIQNWVLFTDTPEAKALYKKFGFVEETIANCQTSWHKIRLQDAHPSYMPLSIERLNTSPSKLILNSTESYSYLFATKRENLNRFWLPSDPVKCSDVTDDSHQKLEACL